MEKSSIYSLYCTWRKNYEKNYLYDSWIFLCNPTGTSLWMPSRSLEKSSEIYPACLVCHALVVAIQKTWNKRLGFRINLHSEPRNANQGFVGHLRFTLRGLTENIINILRSLISMQFQCVAVHSSTWALQRTAFSPQFDFPLKVLFTSFAHLCSIHIRPTPLEFPDRVLENHFSLHIWNLVPSVTDKHSSSGIKAWVRVTSLLVHDIL